MAPSHCWTSGPRRTNNEHDIYGIPKLDTCPYKRGKPTRVSEPAAHPLITSPRPAGSPPSQMARQNRRGEILIIQARGSSVSSEETLKAV